MDIRVSEVLPTRPCDYCLALQDDSVFLDLAKRECGSLFLVRISYDGFGCCEPSIDNGVSNFSKYETKLLIESINNNAVAVNEVTEVLRKYLEANSSVLWREALTEHGLI